MRTYDFAELWEARKNSLGSLVSLYSASEEIGGRIRGARYEDLAYFHTEFREYDEADLTRAEKEQDIDGEFRLLAGGTAFERLYRISADSPEEWEDLCLQRREEAEVILPLPISFSKLADPGRRKEALAHYLTSFFVILYGIGLRLGQEEVLRRISQVDGEELTALLEESWCGYEALLRPYEDEEDEEEPEEEEEGEEPEEDGEEYEEADEEEEYEDEEGEAFRLFCDTVIRASRQFLDRAYQEVIDAEAEAREPDRCIYQIGKFSGALELLEELEEVLEVEDPGLEKRYDRKMMEALLRRHSEEV